MTPPDDRSATPWLYGVFLRCYPSHFRARFENDMRATFARDHARAQAEGAGSLARLWTRGFAEAVRFGLAERLGRDGRANSPHDPHSRRRTPMSSRLAVDWRDAWRALRATPLVTLMAVLSLALGIGANTALFSILNGLVLRTLPVKNPQELTTLIDGSWPNPVWEQMRERQSQFGAGAFAWSTERFDLAGGGETDPVDGAYASGGMFDVLGLSAARGRLLSVSDDVRGGPPVAVVSYGFWVNRLNRADDVVGRTITLERVPFTIVGVMPAGFTGPDVGRACDIIAPLANEPLIRGQRESWLDARSTWFLEIMVRLKPGQSVDQANAALRALQPQIREATIPPDFTIEQQARFLAPEPFTLVPASTGRSGLRTQFQQPLIIMMIVVGAVLLIACANIANLLLARATARRRDLSVRLALGASRGRIARLLLCESLLIAFGGAVLGLFVARGGASFLVSQLNTTNLDTALDLRVLAFTAGVGLLTALIFGVMPAVGASRVSPYEALKEQGRTIAGDRRFGFRNALIVVQVALSLALVVAAGLFIRTFQSLNHVALGVKIDPLLVVRLDGKRTDTATDAGERDVRRRALFDRLLEAARSTPGVKSAALSRVPLLTGGGSNTLIDLPDSQRGRPGIRNPWVNDITPGWFDTHGMHLIAGRDISAQDALGQPRVAVVNEAFVRRYLNGELPLGKHFKRGTPGGRQIDTEIVGVVSDSVYRNIRDGHPATMYLGLRQLEQMGTGVTLTVETEPQARGDLQRRLGDALSAVDGNVAFTMYPLSDRVDRTIAQEKLVAILSGFFGGLALLLASVGLYGVTAYGVSRRRTEIGVRMALGADPSGVIRLILARVAWLVGTGVVVGAAVSFWAAKFVGPALLFGLEARDVRTFLTAALVLAAVGLVTAWLPARRASRIDPTQVLREG